MRKDKCQGLNLLNHFRQINRNIKIEYVQNNVMYNELYFIPYIWQYRLDEENDKSEIKRLNNLIDTYEEYKNVNEKIILKKNSDYGEWTCKFILDNHEYEEVGPTKKIALQNIFKNNNLL